MAGRLTLNQEMEVRILLSQPGAEDGENGQHDHRAQEQSNEDNGLHHGGEQGDLAELGDGLEAASLSTVRKFHSVAAVRLCLAQTVREHYSGNYNVGRAGHQALVTSELVDRLSYSPGQQAKDQVAAQPSAQELEQGAT
jgi:hypothetical protein